MRILNFQKYSHSKWQARHKDKSNPIFCRAVKRPLAFNHPDVPHVNSIKEEVWEMLYYKTTGSKATHKHQLEYTQQSKVINNILLIQQYIYIYISYLLNLSPTLCANNKSLKYQMSSYILLVCSRSLQISSVKKLQNSLLRNSVERKCKQ